MGTRARDRWSTLAECWCLACLSASREASESVWGIMVFVGMQRGWQECGRRPHPQLEAIANDVAGDAAE